jgi:hypothetical protein
VRLKIRRLGGIAGVVLQARFDTAELPAGEASRVEGAVRALAVRAPSGPPLPDAFRYEIARLDDPDSAPIVIDEHDVPPELAGLIERVSESGEIERHEGPR